VPEPRLPPSSRHPRHPVAGFRRFKADRQRCTGHRLTYQGRCPSLIHPHFWGQMVGLTPTFPPLVGHDPRCSRMHSRWLMPTLDGDRKCWRATAAGTQRRRGIGALPICKDHLTVHHDPLRESVTSVALPPTPTLPSGCEYGPRLGPLLVHREVP
jgi:hypothetical protein